MRCWEQSVEWDPDNDAPALGSQGCFAVEKRFGDQVFFHRLRRPFTVKSKLEKAVRRRHMEFVVSILVSRSEEDFEGVALHECREVEWENIPHDMRVVQFRADHELIFRKAYCDLLRRERMFGLREPGLAEVPGKAVTSVTLDHDGNRIEITV